jgi:hypothetical protein
MFPPKTVIKWQEHQINQLNWNFSNKKICLVPQKWKRAKTSYGGYPTKFAGWTQNHTNMVGTPNQPIKSKIKICLVPQKWREAKIRIGATRQKMQVQPIIIKIKWPEWVNQSNRKFSQKKVYLVPQKWEGAKHSYRGYP